jgi:DNA processing protein
MTGTFHFGDEEDDFRAISPYLELGAYEVLWQGDVSFKRIAKEFRNRPGCLPSDLVPRDRAREMASWVVQRFSEAGLASWGVRIHGAGDYPIRLRQAEHPVELLYFAGNWELAESPSIAVVGTRNPSKEGQARARKLVQQLVADDWTVVSGLARGIDTIAHNTAIERDGRTFAVLGTPLNAVYPDENRELQARLSKEFLVVSQVPSYRYSQQTPRGNRLFFPERNITMSALTRATIIVEAGNTSGTLIQARAAIDQGRKLFILDSCFRNPELTWPARFEAQGAIRVEDYSQIRDALRDQLSPD